MNGKGKQPHAVTPDLLEMYDFPLSTSEDMMASFMPYEVEDDEIEGGETEAMNL